MIRGIIALDWKKELSTGRYCTKHGKGRDPMLALYCLFMLALLAAVVVAAGPAVLLWLLAVGVVVAIWGELERRADDR